MANLHDHYIDLKVAKTEVCTALDELVAVGPNVDYDSKRENLDLMLNKMIDELSFMIDTASDSDVCGDQSLICHFEMVKRCCHTVVRELDLINMSTRDDPVVQQRLQTIHGLNQAIDIAL